MVSKSKETQKNAKVDEVELEDSEGEEEVPIKWRNYDIKTIIAIRGEMKEEFTKLTKKKQSIHFICVLCSLIFIWFNKNAKVQMQIGPIGPS